MDQRKDLSPRVVARLIEYDPLTGELTWRHRPVWMFKPNRGSKLRAAARFNAVYAGEQAFTYVNPEGYLKGALFSIPYLAHRVAWVLHYGRWPTGQIDHINGDKGDNRIENLRDVEQTENSLNRKLYKTNKSGTSGVYKRASGRWRACIGQGCKKSWLGTFDTKAEAVAARKAAEKQLGFHPNHGRSA